MKKRVRKERERKRWVKTKRGEINTREKKKRKKRGKENER